ncbi:histidine kinase [Nocardioides sp.]|uniref:sensor histidine kinase n=1 Tax=Nocardioides sp. TaxID=35761 RepID=UPI002627A84C|nr:histidine kinase [Nocardioides sp.]
MEARRPWTLNARGRAWFDATLVLVLLLISALIEISQGTVHGRSAVLVPALIVAEIVPLWWRRSHPVAMLAVVVAAHLVQAVTIRDPLPSQIVVPIALYSAARWGPGWLRLAVVPLTLAAAVVAGWRWNYDLHPSLRQVLTPASVCAAIGLAGWALGVAGSQRDRYLAALLDRAEYLERAAVREVALATQDERARIAREMHDVVAHGLSVIVVQADGARYAGERDPSVALCTLETIAATGRDSLQEMRRLLGLLRTGDSGVTPQPTLADVGHLIAEAVAAGTPVEARLPDPMPSVGDGIGLAAYRFVQEALTNVRKHAGPQAAVEIDLRVEDDVMGRVLMLRVLDDGRGAAGGSSAGSSPAGGDGTPGAGSGTGLGLVGMRERIGLHGGDVDAGPRPGGGWRVRARIPL